jgi:hypothetical protein
MDLKKEWPSRRLDFGVSFLGVAGGGGALRKRLKLKSYGNDYDYYYCCYCVMVELVSFSEP